MLPCRGDSRIARQKYQVIVMSLQNGSKPPPYNTLINQPITYGRFVNRPYDRHH